MMTPRPPARRTLHLDEPALGIGARTVPLPSAPRGPADRAVLWLLGLLAGAATAVALWKLRVES